MNQADWHYVRLGMLKEKHEQRLKHMAELHSLKKQVVAKEMADAREAEERRKRAEGDRQLHAMVSVASGDIDQARELLGASPAPPKPKMTEAETVALLREAFSILGESSAELATAALKATRP